MGIFIPVVMQKSFNLKNKKVIFLRNVREKSNKINEIQNFIPLWLNNRPGIYDYLESPPDFTPTGLD